MPQKTDSSTRRRNSDAVTRKDNLGENAMISATVTVPKAKRQKATV